VDSRAAFPQDGPIAIPMNSRFLSLLKTALAVIVAFASRAVGFAAPDAAPPFGDNVQLRGSLTNSRLRFERDKKGTVAFMGGSITEMNGYRPMVCDILKKRFPTTDFKFEAAGIGSTCSTTGAFRMTTDVFAQGPVDLFFVEFAVNDDQDAAHTRTECIRGLEGIIRHARQINPNIDIVVTFFVNEGMLKTLQSGQTPLTIEAHETVAKHYGVSTINLAKEAAEEITAGKLTWQQYGGVHPAPYGNAIAARMIDELLSRAWAAPLAADAVVQAHPDPAPIDALSYSNGRFIDPKEAQIKSGWTSAVPDWQSLPGSKRPRFTAIPMLYATEPGAEATLSFEGTAIGAYVVAGPDAGIVEATIDDGPATNVDLYHRFSAGLHYPRTVMLGTDLKPGKHVLKLRISPETKSAGHAARIMQFGVN
jgi:lysophospholipase L1-like esterase